MPRTPEQDAELQALIEEQAADMRNEDYQEPERLDGQRTLSYHSDRVYNDYPLGTSEDDPQEALERPLSDLESKGDHTLEGLILEVLEGFHPSWRETYWLVYGEQQTVRRAARAQRLDESTLRYRLRKIKRAIELRIAEEAGWL